MDISTMDNSKGMETQGGDLCKEQRFIHNPDSVENLTSFESVTSMKGPQTKQTFHVAMVIKIACAVLVMTTTFCTNISGKSQALFETSLRVPNDAAKTRVLQEHTNVFVKSSSTFLVQWGTLQSGCRAPPKARMILECSGGELSVLRGSEDCVETRWGGAECALPIDGEESSNGHLWKQGMIVATCDPTEILVENEASLEFIASFSFNYPAACLGQPTEHLPEDPTEWPKGNFETFLEASQLCTSDGNDIHLLEPSKSLSGTEKKVKLFGSTETAVYRAADTCTVPDCSLLGPGFICPPVVLPCHVNPPPLIVSHIGTESCKEAGLADIDSVHEFWNSAQSHQLSSTNLYEAGFGTGAEYHL